jgi:hypothetical protein
VSNPALVWVWAWAVRGIDPVSQLVLVHLADRANENQELEKTGTLAGIGWSAGGGAVPRTVRFANHSVELPRAAV